MNTAGGMTECVKGKKEMDDEFPECRNTRWGYRSTPNPRVRSRSLIFIFIFAVYKPWLLAPDDFAPSHPPARGRTEPVVGGEEL